MLNLRSLSISAASALSVLGALGGVSSANAQSTQPQPQPASGFSRVFAQLDSLLPAPQEAKSKPAQNPDLLTAPTAQWGNVEISRQVGNCGLNCQAGIAE